MNVHSARTKWGEFEQNECTFCKNKMEKIDEKQRVSSVTDEFVCSVCGFVANFVASDVKNYFGVKMAK